MIQPSLFGSDAYGNPIVHATDPPTSLAAAQTVTDNGKRSLHAEIVLGIVRRHPHGLTYVEVWAACSPSEQAELGEAVEVMRRLNDLAKRGDVAKGEIRECAVKGSKMTTWKPGK